MTRRGRPEPDGQDIHGLLAEPGLFDILHPVLQSEVLHGQLGIYRTQQRVQIAKRLVQLLRHLKKIG